MKTCVRFIKNTYVWLRNDPVAVASKIIYLTLIELVVSKVSLTSYPANNSDKIFFTPVGEHALSNNLFRNETLKRRKETSKGLTRTSS